MTLFAEWTPTVTTLMIISRSFRVELSASYSDDVASERRLTMIHQLVRHRLSDSHGRCAGIDNHGTG